MFVFGAKALVTVANAERRRTGDERMIAVLFVVCIRLVGDKIGDVKLLFCIALFACFCNLFLSFSPLLTCVPKVLIPTY